MGGYGFWVFLGIIGVIALYAISIYNKLVLNRQRVEEGWSGIDVQLKRRSNLIPNLVETVKGYAAHEREAFETVTELRAKSMAAAGGSAEARVAAETQLSGALMKLFAVAENYPDLKANENFLGLQKDLAEIEDQIQLARRYYNGSVREMNVLVESFPSNIIAGFFRFTKAIYFELASEAERAVPQIDFARKS